LRLEDQGIEDRLKSVEEKLDRICRAVVGDPTFQQTGLAELVQRHDRWIQKQKMKEARIIGIGTGIGVIWTLFLSLFDRFL